MNDLQMLIVKLFGLYYLIGTIFLIGFLNGNIIMEPKNKFTEAFFNEFNDIIKLSLCLYWPFLMILLWKGMKNNENTK